MIAACLLVLTCGAVLVHGYHLGLEDQDVYLAAIQRNLHPDLYRYNADLFTRQMQGSVFVPMVAASVRITRLPVPWVLFFWHGAAIFLLLLGCWQINRRCFSRPGAQWAGVALVAALLTLPVAGTALYLVDQYLHPRVLATAAILFAVVCVLDRRWVAALLWTAVAVVMHPLMSLFGVSLLVFLAWPEQRSRTLQFVAWLPLGLLDTTSPAWREATLSRSYYFLLRWTWYEWLGAMAPIALLWWFHILANRRGLPLLARTSRRLVYFAVFQFAVAAVITIPPAFLRLAPFQPMRWLHIAYVLFVLLGGGLLGEFILKDRVCRWVLLFLPLCAGMFLAQRQLFPASSHIDWPGSPLQNPWAQAFVWARENTPRDALFAIEPRYMGLRGEDHYGFRALAERSLLAEDQKDPGSATVFPDLAPRWQQEVHAQTGMLHFRATDFRRLQHTFGVDWVVLPAPSPDLDCPYHNRAAAVCRITP